MNVLLIYALTSSYLSVYFPSRSIAKAVEIARIRLLLDPFDEAQAIHQCGLSRRFAGTGLTQLDLSQNALLSVPSSALKDLQHLLILNLNRNKIKNIHKKAFEGLDTLEILSLYENEISYIEEDAFTGLHK